MMQVCWDAAGEVIKAWCTEGAGVAAEPHAHACVCFVRQNIDRDRSRNLILSRKLEQHGISIEKYVFGTN